jgi:uncharacterized protein YprB with RNaseH-like and TPR domain
VVYPEAGYIEHIGRAKERRNLDIREQLAHLRRTVALIDRRYEPLPAPPTLRPIAPTFIEELLSGQVVETALGKHFETERLYGRHQRHGSFDISDLIELPADLLEQLSGGALRDSHPTRWAFLDTETTGLAGGSGTYAFLVGIGWIEAAGFRVRQFFMRDYGEEASMLDAVAACLSRFDVLITYNGRTYDQPLLETRFTMNRARQPFARMEHVDLLHGARRLFSLRLQNCRLVNLENEILGVERDEDIPGELIPYCFFEYVRTRRALRLVPVFLHNAIDILSLACLTGVIPHAFRDPEGVRLRHGADLLGLARWLVAAGRVEEARRMMRRAIDLGLPDAHLFRTLYDVGRLEKKLGMEAESVATFIDLTLSPNPFRARAYEEMARHYERREKNFPMALECVRAARDLEDSDALRSRELRLRARAERLSRQPMLQLSSGPSRIARNRSLRAVTD